MKTLSDESMSKRALAILNEAKNGGMLKKQIPSDNETRIKVANYIVDEARKRRENGERGAHIQNILFTADVDWSEDEEEKKYREYINEELEDGLPIPPEIKGEIPEFPADITQVSTQLLRKLNGDFNACSARIGWLYALEEAGQSAAKQIADSHEEAYIITADRKDIGGKAKAQKLLEAEARAADKDIVKWRDREKRHANRANKYKRLLDAMNNHCDRLSREFSMRQEEMK